MAKSEFKIETLVLSIFMVAHVMLPLSMNAQGVRSDNYFRSDVEVNEIRDIDWLIYGLITNDSFGAPLGNGLLMMAMAGAAYAFKRKIKLRRGIMAKSLCVLLLFFGLTQCKKNVHDVVSANDNEFSITLDVGDDLKANVNPLTGKVTFAEGNEIVVANHGVYVGTLTYHDGTFSGNITGAVESDYLHFYNLGNKITSTLTLGKSMGCSVSIGNQTAEYPVISYAPSTVKFSQDISSYSARLQNKCALVKFDVTSSSPYAGVCIKGMNNKIFIMFDGPTFEYSSENDGKITLPSGSGERWAILLPQPEIAAGSAGSALSGMYTGTRGSVPEITEDDYISDGIPVVVETLSQPQGVKTGLFTVNSDGKQVRFAQGSTYYKINDNTWRFMLNQRKRMVVGDYVAGDYHSGVSHVEYFGWGATGFKHGAVCYKTRSTTTTNSDYYAYNDAGKNLYDESGYADWGCNSFFNNKGAYKQWRTITAEELAYMMESRENAAEKYALATVVGSDRTYYGLMVLPDNWTAPYENCFTPGITGGFSQNTYDETQWSQMDAAGMLFLPCSGKRVGGQVYGIGSYGCYWTSSVYDNDKAYSLYISEEEVDWRHVEDRFTGMCVRLLIE